MKAIVLVALFVLASCATSVRKTNELNLGMSKKEVISILGTPDSTRGAGTETHLTYRLHEGAVENKILRGIAGVTTFGIVGNDRDDKDYVFVFGADNNLVKFGRIGDFGTTAPDTVKVIHAQE